MDVLRYFPGYVLYRFVRPRHNFTITENDIMIKYYIIQPKISGTFKCSTFKFLEMDQLIEKWKIEILMMRVYGDKQRSQEEVCRLFIELYLSQ